MTNKEYLSFLFKDGSAENCYETMKKIFEKFSSGYSDSRLALIGWLDSERSKNEEDLY